MSEYKVYVAIDLDTDFYISWNDYTYTAKQVKDGVVELVTQQFPVGTNGYTQPIFFKFNSEQEAAKRDFYFDVYYKGTLVATDIRSREYDEDPSAWLTPSYQLKEGHRKPDFKADPSRFKLKTVVHRVQQITMTTSNQSSNGTQMTQVVSSNINQLIQMIGYVIAHGEGGYEAYNTGTQGVIGKRVGHSYLHPPSGTVTGKTINQIIATKTLSGYDKSRLFATGKYQTTIDTLTEAKNRLGLTGEELYSAQIHERVFRDYLFDKAGGGKLADYVKRGKGSVDDAMYAASKEWASIAAPAGRAIKTGQISDGTLSYYEGRANHANQQSTAELRRLLESVKLGANKLETLQTTKIDSIDVEPVSGVQVLFNGVKSDRQAIVSQKTKNILAAMAKEAGMSRIYITSTLRTPEEQARILRTTSIQYAPAGEDVKAIGRQYLSQGKDIQIKMMAERIRWYLSRGERVSKHCVTVEMYEKLNVVDVGLNSNGFVMNGSKQLNALGLKFETVFNKYMASGFITRKSLSGSTKGEGLRPYNAVN